MDNNGSNLGKIIRRRRVKVPLTLQQLGSTSGVSPSHLGRIEKGGRFPSARVLRRIAKPLGFEEDELFILAGYLSPYPRSVAKARTKHIGGQLDLYAAGMLAREPVEVQRAIISTLTTLKSIAKSIGKE